MYVVVCGMLEDGIAGILGPQSKDTWHLVQSLCDTVEMPHIETMWDHTQRRGSCLVNLFPHPSTLARVRDYYFFFYKSIVFN